MLPSDEVAIQTALRQHLPKLSVSLLEVARPLVEAIGDDLDETTLRVALQIASIAWIRTSADRDESFLAEADELLRSLANERAVLKVLSTMEDRRRELFLHDLRMPADVEVGTDAVGGLGFQVATAASNGVEAWVAAGAPNETRDGLAPEFVAFVSANGLDHRFVEHGLPTSAADLARFERRRIRVKWWFDEADWDAPPITSLLRGDVRPPQDDDLSRHDPKYLALLMAIELGVLAAASLLGRIPTDRDIGEVYNQLRRHPDGRGTGRLFDIVWQTTALALVGKPVSPAEFEAVVRQLERSVRRHRTWDGASDYVPFLREQFAGVED